jgi:hypothetical protein
MIDALFHEFNRKTIFYDPELFGHLMHSSISGMTQSVATK